MRGLEEAWVGGAVQCFYGFQLSDETRSEYTSTDYCHIPFTLKQVGGSDAFYKHYIQAFSFCFFFLLLPGFITVQVSRHIQQSIVFSDSYLQLDLVEP